MADFTLEAYPDDGPLYEHGPTLACRCCGESNLHWLQNHNYKWVLANTDNTIHDCPVNPLNNNH